VLVVDPQYLQIDLPPRVKDSHIDEWLRFVWRDYKDANYTTFYSEDYTGYHLHFWNENGAKEQVADYFDRVYWASIERRHSDDVAADMSSVFCYNDVPKHQLALDYYSR
jgi:hypothetical protein